MWQVTGNKSIAENLVVCSKCGTINRFPPARPAIDAKCGRCKAKVFAGQPEDVASTIFDRPDRAQHDPGSRRCLDIMVRTMPHDGVSL